MSMSTPKAKKTGRRPGAGDSRDLIAAAARAEFAAVGYDRATVRAIAKAADVDPALVMHFFGSKEQLFQKVMEVPGGIPEMLARFADGPRETVGHRLAEFLVTSLENPASREILLARLRSAMSHPYAAELVRQTASRDLTQLAAALTEDRPELRAALLGSHSVGIAVARYIVQVEPLASLPAQDLIEMIAPVFQHYLTAPLTES